MAGLVEVKVEAVKGEVGGWVEAGALKVKGLVEVVDGLILEEEELAICCPCHSASYSKLELD